VRWVGSRLRRLPTHPGRTPPSFRCSCTPG